MATVAANLLELHALHQSIWNRSNELGITGRRIHELRTGINLNTDDPTVRPTRSRLAKAAERLRQAHEQLEEQRREAERFARDLMRVDASSLITELAAMASPTWTPLPPLVTLRAPIYTTFGPDGTSIVGQIFHDLKANQVTSGPAENHMRIIETDSNPPRLIIVLAGVQDLSSAVTKGADGIKQLWPIVLTGPVGVGVGVAEVGRRVVDEVVSRPGGTPRDLSVAIPQHFANGGDYVLAVQQRVTEYLRMRALSTGTEAVLIGHSHGAITAVDLAASSQFNGGLVRITHVIAAGAGQAGDLDEPLAGTSVLAVTNTQDDVSAVIYATDLSKADRSRSHQLPADRFEHRANGGSLGRGHDTPNYVNVVHSMDGRSKAFIEGALHDLGGTTARITDVPLV